MDAAQRREATELLTELFVEALRKRAVVSSGGCGGAFDGASHGVAGRAKKRPDPRRAAA